MKKVFILFVGLLLHNVTHAANLMPALKKVRDKIDQALQDAKTISFKDLVHKQNEKNQVINAHGSCIEHACTDKKVIGIQEKIDVLYWSKQSDMIIAIKSCVITDSAKARIMLKDMINQRHAEKKAPLIIFAQDLEREEKMLGEISQELTKLYLAKDVRADKQGLAKRVQELQATVKNMSHTLQDLIGMVNTLLM